MKKQTEETMLKGNVKDYLAWRGIFNYHILQGMGAYKGIPDRIMHYKGMVHYLEIKKQGGKMSDNQLAFQEQCMNDCVPYHVVKSLEELEDIISKDTG